MARAILPEPPAHAWAKSSSRAALSPHQGNCEIRCQAVKVALTKEQWDVGGEEDEELLLCPSAAAPNPAVLNSPGVLVD